jgi:hypothetical protein
MVESRLHWYCFTFIGDGELGKNCYASTYTGYSDKKITKARITENKKYAKVTNTAVLISCSYLGFITKVEFLD